MYNSNNYGYSPYGRYIPQQPIQQPIMQQVTEQVSGQVRTGLQGRQVESIEQAKLLEYPLDGSTSFFPLTDGSCIVTKQLQNDGTSKTKIYKLVDDSETKQPKYATLDDIKNEIEQIDFSDIDDLKDEIKDLKQEIKDLKKKKVKDE